MKRSPSSPPIAWLIFGVLCLRPVSWLQLPGSGSCENHDTQADKQSDDGNSALHRRAGAPLGSEAPDAERDHGAAPRQLHEIRNGRTAQEPRLTHGGQKAGACKNPGGAENLSGDAVRFHHESK